MGPREQLRKLTLMRITVTALLALGLSVAATVAPRDVPTPTVTLVPGDTPGSAGRNYPFFSTDIVLSNYGYLEQEFFFEGTANTYAAAQPGAHAEIATRGTPYRSRLLVRRPAQQARFNGTVIVEWFNVTNGYDTDVLWLYQKEFLIREGYAWVGVSAQNVGVARPPNGLKVWSPARYGTLDVDGGGKVTGDALAYDIYSQAAAAVRGVPAVLGGLRFGQVIAAGQSQSAGRLATYFNGIHDRAPIYDAAMLTVNTTPIRAEVSVPVIKVLSENEAATSRNQEDSAKIRTWTVAGSTHSEQYLAHLTRGISQARPESAGGRRVRDAGAVASRDPLRLQRRRRCPGEMEEVPERAAKRATADVCGQRPATRRARQRARWDSTRGDRRAGGQGVGRRLRSRWHARAVRDRNTQQPVSEPRRLRRQGARRVRGDRQSRVPPPGRRGTDHRRGPPIDLRQPTHVRSALRRPAPVSRATRRRCCSRSRRPHCSSRTATRSCGCSTT